MASLLTGLAVYYNMNGNANDLSGNGNSGTATNVTFSIANGKIQQGGGFNGSSSTIIKTNSTLATGVVARTIACWAKTSVNNNNYPIAFATSTVKNGTIDSSSLAFYMAPSTNKISLGTFGPTPEIEGPSILDNNWHFLVGTSDGTTIQFYVDNVIQGSKTQTISFFNKNINVGCLLDGAGLYWTGQIDECGVWNRVLTQNEITTLWNGGQGMTYPFVQPAMFLSFL